MIRTSLTRLRPTSSPSALATLVTSLKACAENGLPSFVCPRTTTTTGVLRCLLHTGMLRGFRYSHQAMGYDVFVKFMVAATRGGGSAECAVHGVKEEIGWVDSFLFNY